MRTIHFKSGKTATISQEDLNNMVLNKNGLMKIQTFTDKQTGNVYLLLNMEEIEFID